MKWELSRVVRADVLQNTAERKREKLRLMTGMENGKNLVVLGCLFIPKVKLRKIEYFYCLIGPVDDQSFFKIAMKYHRAALQAREDP